MTLVEKTLTFFVFFPLIFISLFVSLTVLHHTDQMLDGLHDLLNSSSKFLHTPLHTCYMCMTFDSNVYSIRIKLEFILSSMDSYFRDWREISPTKLSTNDKSPNPSTSFLKFTIYISFYASINISSDFFSPSLQDSSLIFKPLLTVNR